MTPGSYDLCIYRGDTGRWRFLLALALCFVAGAVQAQQVPNPMAKDAANVQLPQALDNLKVPVAYVEAYRQPGDSPTNDTALVQRACDAVKASHGVIVFAPKTYNIGQVTVGAEGQRVKCDLRGTWNGDVGVAAQAGTYIKSIAGTNGSVIVVPTTAPPVEFRDLWLDGNKAANTCGSQKAVIEFPSAAGPGKQRSGIFKNVRIENGCNDGIFAGTLRNAGVLDHTVILGARNNGLTMGSNSDWRFLNSDLQGTEYAFRCTGCGSLTSVVTNYFSSKVGIRIDIDAQDLTFFGGSVDRNTLDGVQLVGANNPNTKTRTFSGVRFSLNGLSANDTYADIKLFAEPAAVLIGNQFLKGTGSAFPKHLVYSAISEGPSTYKWIGNYYGTGTDQPFVTSPLAEPASAVGQSPGVVCRAVNSATHTGTTAETVVATCSLPAYAMQIGQRVELLSLWHFTGSTNNKLVRVRFGAAGAGLGGVVVAQMTINTAASISLRCSTEVWARSATAQVSGPVTCGAGNAGTTVVASAVNLAAASEFAITAELASAGESMVLDAYTGTLYP